MADAADILQFERENRAYFTQWVPDRGDDYFIPANMERFLAEIEAEQARGECYMYLVRLAGELVGRVNLTDVKDGAASLGYRMGQRHSGKGYATEAVRLALREAAARGITTVRAMTTGTNLGSQSVLLRNGFQPAGAVPRALEVNGERHDAVLFSKSLLTHP